MNEYDDINAYSGDLVHDMWVDYDYNANTDELSDYFDDDDAEDGDSFDEE